MRGDANGDGAITLDDVQMVANIYSKVLPVPEDPEDYAACDINDDGAINVQDNVNIQEIVINKVRPGAYAEITGAWSANPEYATEDAQFFADIPVEGMSVDCDAIIVITEGDTATYIRGECLSGAIRIYVSAVPISNVQCDVIWHSGTGRVSFAGLPGVRVTGKEYASRMFLYTIGTEDWGYADEEHGWNVDSNQAPIFLEYLRDFNQSYVTEFANIDPYSGNYLIEVLPHIGSKSFASAFYSSGMKYAGRPYTGFPYLIVQADTVPTSRLIVRIVITPMAT